ncbi:MAG: TIGR03089 family protein [Gordonia sp. (in: high G+C Gram-positive bacteria)]
MSEKTLTAALFGAIADWSKPLFTFYDDRSGERTELSGATLGNWAAKTANFLVTELGVIPGDEIVVDLPEHWQSAAILLGAWWSGAHIRLSDADLDGTAVAAITTVDAIDHYRDADELLVASLDPFALGVRDLPRGVGDYASSVRVHGDQYTPPRYGGAALEGLSAEEITSIARSTAAAEGIRPGSRVLSTREWHSRDGVIATLVAPLSVGASLVWVAPTAATDLPARAASERADIVLD